MNTQVLLPIALCIITSCNGCGTLTNVMPTELSHIQGKPALNEVYGGVKRNVSTIQSSFNNLRRNNKAEQSISHLQSFVRIAANAIDAPFSLIGDTVTLYRTIPAATDRAVNDYYFPDKDVVYYPSSLDDDKSEK